MFIWTSEGLFSSNNATKVARAVTLTVVRCIQIHVCAPSLLSEKQCDGDADLNSKSKYRLIPLQLWRAVSDHRLHLHHKFRLGRQREDIFSALYLSLTMLCDFLF